MSKETLDFVPPLPPKNNKISSAFSYNFKLALTGLGNRIREERLRLHLTQAQLAEDVDISDTYMGAIERGERSLTLDTLVRLVNRLGVTVDYLLADSVSDSDANIMEQFKQIMDQQPLERRQMAINVLRTIFSYFDDTEGA